MTGRTVGGVFGRLSGSDPDTSYRNAIAPVRRLTDKAPPRVTIHAAAAICILALATPVYATDWVPVVKDLARKVPRIEVQIGEDKGACSGVVINASAGYALSAAHCFHKSSTDEMSITLSGRHAELVRSNALLDIAVLRFAPKNEQAMCLATEAPALGSDVLIAGFAFGAKALHVQTGNVSNVMDEDDRLVVAADVIFGDSGGAAIDANGCLVGMVSALRAIGPAHLGVMVPASLIRDFVDGYLPTK